MDLHSDTPTERRPIQLRYPSTDFSGAWRNAVKNGADFNVDALIGRWRRNAVKISIEYSSNIDGKKLRNLEPLAFLFCMELMNCIAAAHMSGKYSIKYFDSTGELLIQFRRI